MKTKAVLSADDVQAILSKFPKHASSNMLIGISGLVSLNWHSCQFELVYLNWHSELVNLSWHIC